MGKWDYIDDFLRIDLQLGEDEITRAAQPHLEKLALYAQQHEQERWNLIDEFKPVFTELFTEAWERCDALGDCGEEVARLMKESFLLGYLRRRENG